jgi:DNA-dependent metalloprotease WSS1
MPLENVVDTMLHELCHIVHGPHNSDFHALWDQLRDEQQGLIMKGYTGEGFLSEGRRLGGARIPPAEARRLARESAERRRRQPSGTGPGIRLGGVAARQGEDIRRVIADAVERRNKTLKGCGTDNFSDRQIRDIADTATRNGFRTQAEEDEANEAAIAQAMWELVQEDEKTKQGNAYIPPSTRTMAGPSRTTRPQEPAQNKRPNTGSYLDAWACQVCTLQNPATYLCCDACGTERGSPGESARAPRSTQPAGTTNATVIDLTGSPPHSPRRGAQRPEARRQERARHPSQQENVAQPAPAATWQCSFCGHLMERKWWTCSSCGLMKDHSR